MNTVNTLSTCGYTAQAAIESAWSTLIKLDRQARRDTHKVVRCSDAAYRYLSSPTMIHNYRLFAKMSYQIAEIMWLVVLALAATIAQLVESAQPTQSVAAEQSNTEESAQPVQSQPVEQFTSPVEQFAISTDNSASPSAAIVAPNLIAVADSVIPAGKSCPVVKSFRRNQIKVQPNIMANSPTKPPTIRELKKLASEAGIVGYSNMTKAQLLEALALGR